MAGASEQKHIRVGALDELIQVQVNEIDARACSPMTQQPIFDVLRLERFLQQHVVLEIHLGGSQVIHQSKIAILNRRGSHTGTHCANTSLPSSAAYGSSTRTR